MQKYHTIDYLTKTRVRSDGRIKQYYVEDSHPAIISEEDFTLVQNEMERRRGIGRNYSGGGPFATKLVCECCGAYFGSKIWHSRDQYRRVVWHCNHRYGGGKPCATPHVTEDMIKERFLAAFNQLLVDRERVVADCRLAQRALDDGKEIRAALAEAQREMEVVEGLAKKCIEANASATLNQEEYAAQYNGYVARHKTAKERAQDLERQLAGRRAQRREMERLIRALEQREAVVTKFDNILWMEAVDKVTVRKDGKLVFVFKDGTEITV